ncbi:ABC transporter substrate-binding protein [Mycobacterium sp.]|uniref:ABC transporter substrate-binding protein n=1 Tax=Mycobacterium sp. TaxID=1785 RepID=UPI0031DFEB4B
MAARRRRVAASWLAAALAAAGLPAGCSTGAAAQVDYVVDGPLVTYNASTVTGAASAGAQAFARTLTGFGYHGPDGQVIADHDFGTVAVVGGAPLVLDYQIADDAVYSDGTPITCDDLVLTWAAHSGRFPGFDAASKAGYIDVADIECEPGQKKARVSFAPDRNVVDYNQLFTATSMMPSHVIAEELGRKDADVTAALLADNAPVVDRIAQVWNTTWNLKPGLDPKHFPSSGPYRIESVLVDGGVVLVANDRWWGAAPMTKRIRVRPQKADIADQVTSRSLDVVDVAAGSSGSLPVLDGYQRTDYPSDGIEQLIFAPHGPLSETKARRAVALCTPRDVIARDAGVPIANTRLQTVATQDAIGQAEGGAEAGEFSRSDPDGARGVLGGAPLTVRIGYHAPNARLAAAVGAIAKACAPGGIVVSDVASDTTGPQSLTDGTIDVLVASIGGATGSGSAGSSAMDAYALYTGNGNNLSGYGNGQIDGVISAMAVSADVGELVRLLSDSAPVLWADMPTLPLYRQQRMLMASKKMYAVSGNPTRWGAGWNMDRWVRSR